MEMQEKGGEKGATNSGDTKSKNGNKEDNSCLTFTATLGIVILMIINVLTLLLGIGMIVIGALIKTQLDQDDDVTDLLEMVDFGSFTLKTIVYVLIGVVIACGVFTTLTSLAGGIGALFGLRVLLIIYVIILVLVIILEIVVLAFWIYLLSQTNSSLRGLFEDLLLNYNGVGDTSVVSVGWNLIFILFDCCGVTPVTSSYNDFEQLPTTWWASRGSDVIPFSCCLSANRDTYQSKTDTACTQSLQNYQTSGCYDTFDNLFTSLGSAAISITTILLLIEVVAVFFSIVIVIAVSKGKKVGIVDRYKSVKAK